nr:hypothetical protein [Tanacetum cinerariifolium]
MVCNTSRWKDSNTPGKKVPKKVLRYFLVIPRLQRLYKSSHTAKEMIWHATGKCTEPGKMQHPVDGRAWKKFDTKYPDFAKEPRNVRLGLAADGFNQFSNLSQAYSMWPGQANKCRCFELCDVHRGCVAVLSYATFIAAVYDIPHTVDNARVY